MQSVVWYNEQSLVEISILDLIVIVLIKTSLSNLIKYKVYFFYKFESLL